MPSFRSCQHVAVSAALVVLSAFSTLAQTKAPRPAGDILKIAAPDDSGRILPVRLFRPDGAGPFRLAIINHGSPRASERARASVIPVGATGASHRSSKKWPPPIAKSRGTSCSAGRKANVGGRTGSPLLGA